MGVYADIQTELGLAFDTDLSDAVATINFVTYTNVYNETTLQNVLTPTSIAVRAVKELNITGENIDDVTANDVVRYIVLDGERNGVVFAKEMKIVDGTSEYKVSGIRVDPAGATHTITARRWS